MKHKAALFWSGGKDSAFTLYHIQKFYPHLEVVYLVTTINEEYGRISMHGVREELLEIQAAGTGIPLYKMIVPNIPSNTVYETVLNETFLNLKQEGVNHIIYGDIFLEDLKQYRINLLKPHQLTAVFPLWKRDTTDLLKEFISLGFKTITCCVNTACLPEKFIAKQIDAEFMNALPQTADVCGENGEFHTFCFAGPIFNKQIDFSLGEKIYKPLVIEKETSTNETGFWYVDLIPES